MTGFDDDAIADLQATADELIAGVEQERQELREQRDKDREGADEKQAELEEARRRGEHGRDWQVLQGRIDLRQTTQDDILFGLDHSQEAQAVRKIAGANLAKVRDSYREQFSDPDGELAGSMSELAAAQEGLALQLQRLRELDLRVLATDAAAGIGGDGPRGSARTAGVRPE